MKVRPRKGNTRSLECFIPKTRYFSWQHSVILYAASWSILVLLQICHYFMQMTVGQANERVISANSDLQAASEQAFTSYETPCMQFEACTSRVGGESASCVLAVLDV